MTDFLLDLQPGLAQVIAATSGGNTTRYVHSSRGVHAQEDPSGNWTYPLHDGLGSARGEVTDALAVGAQHHYAPYGERSGGSIAGGFDPTPFGFTGEQTDANDLLYLRARHYAPGLGVFTALDPVEGGMGNSMTLNRYGYVGGNPTNLTDHTGMFIDRGVGGVSYADMTAFGQLRTQRLRSRATQQMRLLGWVNQMNTCSGGISGLGAGFGHTNFSSVGFGNLSFNPQSQISNCPPGYRDLIEFCKNDETDEVVPLSVAWDRYLAQQGQSQCMMTLKGACYSFCDSAACRENCDNRYPDLPLRTGSCDPCAGIEDGTAYYQCLFAQGGLDPNTPLLLVGGRFDISGHIAGVGLDLNVEVQIVPHYLLDTRFWLQRPFFGVVINPGVETGTSLGDFGTNIGAILGYVNAGSFGQHTLTNYSVGASGIAFLGPGIEADVSAAEDFSSLIAFVGLGGGAGLFTAFGGTSSSIFIDPGELIVDVMDELVDHVFRSLERVE